MTSTIGRSIIAEMRQVIHPSNHLELNPLSRDKVELRVARSVIIQTLGPIPLPRDFDDELVFSKAYEVWNKRSNDLAGECLERDMNTLEANGWSTKIELDHCDHPCVVATRPT